MQVGKSSGSAILSVLEVTKKFGGLTALFELSLDVYEGEIVGLMGPNGAGKSTLLSIIAGQYAPDRGEIRFRGTDISGLAPHKICRLGVARSYQIPQPFSSLSVLQNVVVGAIYGRGLGKEAAEIEAREILKVVGLWEKKDVLAKDLVTITLKRLELARALATGPEVILLDEVAAGLTEAEIPVMLEILETVRGRGITIVMIEHVIRVMLGAVDRLIVIDKGEKIAEGDPGTVVKDKEVVRAYFG